MLDPNGVVRPVPLMFKVTPRFTVTAPSVPLLLLRMETVPVFPCVMLTPAKFNALAIGSPTTIAALELTPPRALAVLTIRVFPGECRRSTLLDAAVSVPEKVRSAPAMFASETRVFPVPPI